MRKGLIIAAALGALTAAMPISAQDAIMADAAAKQAKPRDSNGLIRLGNAIEATLEDEGDYYLIDGRAGQHVRIALTSDDFDPVLRLAGADGFEVRNDDGPDAMGLGSLIEARLPADGRYELHVTAFGDRDGGRYRIATMDPANPAPGDTTAIALGESVEGSLARGDGTGFDGAHVDYYAFAGRAGQRITFDLASQSVDTALTVYLPSGRGEYNDDRGGAQASTDSLLSLTLPQDGTYHIAASSFAPGERGAYTLAVREAAEGVRTVRPASGTSRVFALSVGVADYRRMNPLSRTDQDAEQVVEALAEAGVLAPGSVTLLNRDATRERFAAALTELSAVMGEDDLLLLFFSGHGEKVENVDTERDGSAETLELYDAALFDHELTAMLDGFSGRLLLVIDACFAGGFDQVVDAADDRMGIFSSDADTLSLVAQRDKAGGYVSHILRDALRGEADLDRDRAVTAGELSEYMRRAFYRVVLDSPLDTDAEDFRDARSPGFQHIVVDRGGDGMPASQVLMDLGSAEATLVARRD
ncbi:pre-peptidase C-terminal domain-containing protein [Aurantiacibacter aquimixticola]|nr:pre-peptidase C-terminal domain-containing protein [Aurantiacibacter aquimixticola]